MNIEFCGVRGSIPKPLSANELLKRISVHAKDGHLSLTKLKSLAKNGTLGYGGDTSCVYIEEDEQSLILDAGTGLRRLGQRMMADDRPIDLLLTHLHWDHIQGLPFFTPIYQKGREIRVHSAIDPEKIKNAFRHQWQHPYFPVPFEELQATLKFVGFKKNCKIGKFKVSSVPMLHPDPTFGYRIEAGGKSYAHFSDTELRMLTPAFSNTYKKFLEGVDFLTADAQFDMDEIDTFKTWGHSAAISFLDLLKDSNVKTLATFHYNPQADEENIDRIFAEAKAHLKKNLKGCKTKLIAAIEGQTHTL